MITFILYFYILKDFCYYFFEPLQFFPVENFKVYNPVKKCGHLLCLTSIIVLSSSVSLVV